MKKANIGVTPGLREYVNAFVSDAATGKGGYLQQRGLIPLAAGRARRPEGRRGRPDPRSPLRRRIVVEHRANRKCPARMGTQRRPSS